MSKLLESLVTDAMNRVKNPDVQAALQTNIFAPILARILDVLYPYLMAIVGLWAVMFLGIIAILIILIRSKTAVGIQ